MEHYDIEINALGLRCPLPLLRTKEAIRNMKKGQVLRVISSDPQSKRDFEAFSRQTGHSLLSVKEENGEIILFLKLF